jgi:molybdopterin/thiamine biosynthesis adenylyltransferase
MFAQLFVVLVALLPLMLNAYRGVDVSSRVYTSNWQCMADNGYSFAIVRVYQSNGKPDANGPYTINDAHSGGISYVDGYIFPCFDCGDPEGQMDATISSLSNANIRITGMHNQTLADANVVGASVGMLWIDVEG